jgi:hypothetical protein
MNRTFPVFFLQYVFRHFGLRHQIVAPNAWKKVLTTVASFVTFRLAESVDVEQADQMRLRKCFTDYF